MNEGDDRGECFERFHLSAGGAHMFVNRLTCLRVHAEEEGFDGPVFVQAAPASNRFIALHDGEV